MDQANLLRRVVCQAALEACCGMARELMMFENGYDFFRPQPMAPRPVCGPASAVWSLRWRPKGPTSWSSRGAARRSSPDALTKILACLPLRLRPMQVHADVMS